MEYKEEDYLLLSGIQHFVFCRRQWALIHIEQQWAENYRTTAGELMHKRAHEVDMLLLVTYDVSTQDSAGKRRLRKVAKECVNYGQRVQNSVFECLVDASQALLLKDKLVNMIDKEQDSLRFYYLGNKYDTKIEHFGVKSTYEPEGILMV